MNISQILEKENLSIPKENIYLEEDMKKHTSFKIGGPAECLIKIQTVEQLKEILDITKQNQIPLTVLGNGSNVLVLDKGIKGIVLKIDIKKLVIEEKEEKEEKIEIIVGSGNKLTELAQKLAQKEITGMEELAGIPGTIGGAIFMNAGAHGKEMKDIVTQITATDYQGSVKRFTKEEAEFAYRTSRFSKGNLIIIEAKFCLEKGKKEEIKQKMSQYLDYRREKQPLEYPSAGSTFKRGTDFVTAALIDQAGLKGYSVGGAQISKKHAGFIINQGNATAKDVIELVNHTKKVIKETFEKQIELEVKVLGEE